MNMFHYMNM